MEMLQIKDFYLAYSKLSKHDSAIFFCESLSAAELNHVWELMYLALGVS